MRLNPLHFLSKFWTGANQSPTPAAGDESTSTTAFGLTTALPAGFNPSTNPDPPNPFLKVPTQPKHEARPIRANIYTITPPTQNESTSKTSFNPINALPAGVNPPAKLDPQNPFLTVHTQLSTGARPMAANIYSFTPLVAPLSNTAFPAYVAHMKNTVGNIPIPRTPIFTKPNLNNKMPTPATTPSSTTPLSASDPSPSSAPPPPQKTDRVHESTSSLTSPPNNGRPKLQAKCQNERHIRVRKKSTNWSSEIVYEVDDPKDPLPAGYSGTFRGIRFYSSDFGVNMKCHKGLHHLSCDHWIKTDEESPCGLNCHEADFDVAPFICPTCRGAVTDIIENQLSKDEKAKIDRAHKAGQETYVVGYLVEFVSKRINTKANITETVVSIVRDGTHGRQCIKADAPENAGARALEEDIKEFQQWKADREFAKQHPESKGSKRRPSDHEVLDSLAAEDDTNEQRDQTARHATKKQKQIHVIPSESLRPEHSHTIGPLVRKRHQDVELDVNKRSRREVVVRTDGDEVPQWDPRLLNGE